MNSIRGTHWSVTLNMKKVSRETCEAQIETARQANWGVQGQIEEGDEGTPHYQLLVKTPQVRMTAVKKIFYTAHIEKARNIAALETYVHKGEGRLEEMKTIERKFVQFPEIRKKFFQWVIEEGHEQVGDYDRKLSLWDEFISLSIMERVECDVVGVNPQYRSIIQKYWSANVFVAQEDRQRSIDRQTDRQTAEINVAEDDITDALSEEVREEDGQSTSSSSSSSGLYSGEEEEEQSTSGSLSESSTYIEERPRNKGRGRRTLQ